MPIYNKKDEISLYPSIRKWLEEYLQNKHPKAEVAAFDIHSSDLSNFLQRSKYKKYFPEYATYKIQIDLLGVIIENDKCSLAFVEVKDTQINLMNLSQLLGYCKIFNPDIAFLVSPKGLSAPLNQLLNHFNRLDILRYSPHKSVCIAKWNIARNAIDNNTAISYK